MSTRKAATPSPETAPARTALARLHACAEVLRPDLSGRGLARLAGRAALVGVFIAAIAALADWSARGFLDRGGLERLIAMKPPIPPSGPKQAAKADRPFDRGRLKAVLAADQR